MAVSNFKMAQDTIVYAYVDQLIKHATNLDPSQTNFRIAEEFIVSNLEAHTFPDTNDNDMKRQFKNLQDKFIIHNQSDKVDRLNYLHDAFMKRKLKNTGGGFGDVHYSVLRLLLLLQKSPTDLDNIEEFNKKRVYYTKEELEAIEDKKMQDLLKIQTEEDKVIDAIQEEWVEECQDSSEYESGDDQEDDVKDKEVVEDQVVTERIEQFNKGDVVKYTRVDNRNIEDSQQYFGGMPLGRIKAPIIKIVQKIPKKPWAQKTKKFSINAFLDKYLSELQPPVNPYYDYVKKKETDELEQEKDKQERLKTILNVRTFDQLQIQLSTRVIDKDLNGITNQPSYSIENPKLSSFSEPLNLMQDQLGKQKDEMGYINYNIVTERQLVMDSLLLMQQFETPTFTLSKRTQGHRQLYEKRKPIQLRHISTKMLDSLLDEFLQMGNIVKATLWYLEGLKEQQSTLGMVFESFTYQIDLIIARFNSEIIDIQQIAILQAGQISKQQLCLNPIELSLISKLLNVEEPITLLRLKDILETHVFKKIKLIHEIMRNGVMDYLIIDEDYNFMKVHEFDDTYNLQTSQKQIDGDQSLPAIQLDKIKPADRVTFLLNYLFIVIKNNQLLNNFTELNLLKEIFIASIEPYIGIMSDWIDKGELKDPKQEFFIKANPKVFENQNDQGDNTKQASSQTQWKESFIFRTINLHELMGHGNQGVGPFLQAAEHQKTDISIPIFLRPVMKEILSIGKSIKIVRYLDKLNIVKSGFDDFFDFRSVFKDKLDLQLLIVKQKDGKFNYYDEDKHEPNAKLMECGDKNLNNIWDPSYTIGNIMNESANILNYRELLNVAPFQWSSTDQDNQGLGIFQIPQIQKNLNASFASTQFSDNHHTPDKNTDHLMLDVEMKSVHNDQSPKHQALSEVKKSLIDEEKYQILSNKYNYNFQELSNYEESMNYYQAFKTFDYLMKNSLLTDDNELQSTKDVKIYNFKQQTIENLIKECLSIPIQQIYSKTCSRFVKRLNSQCKLQQNIKILRQIFFMEAGHQMHQFATQIYKQMDKGRSIDNLYMINGHFNECVCQSLKGINFIDQMRVVFTQDPKNYSIQSINALDFVHLNFQSEWPLEIILDKQTINQYNLILQQLMKIKRVNYLLSLNDYWIKPKANLKPYSKMNIKEQIMYKNKLLLDKLLHQMQITQKEFLHFSNNLEYYLKTRAIQQICNELDLKLADIQSDVSGNLNADLDTNSMIDMDALVQIHQDFLMNIMRLCLLDNKSKTLLDVVLKVLQVCLNFRELCLKYLLRPENYASNMKNEEGDLLDLSDDLGLNLSEDGSGEPDKSNKESEIYGRGLLRIDSIKFIDRIEECTVELNEMKSRFRTYMQILIETLKKYTKKGVFSYLDEAFTRFNFNSFYMSRDREGLD